jgi:hypothetical protein
MVSRVVGGRDTWGGASQEGFERPGSIPLSRGMG